MNLRDSAKAAYEQQRAAEKQRAEEQKKKAELQEQERFRRQLETFQRLLKEALGVDWQIPADVTQFKNKWGYDNIWATVDGLEFHLGSSDSLTLYVPCPRCHKNPVYHFDIKSKADVGKGLASSKVCEQGSCTSSPKSSYSSPPRHGTWFPQG
jgi:hypothetical protein